MAQNVENPVDSVYKCGQLCGWWMRSCAKRAAAAQISQLCGGQKEREVWTCGECGNQIWKDAEGPQGLLKPVRPERSCRSGIGVGLGAVEIDLLRGLLRFDQHLLQTAQLLSLIHI